MTTPTDDTCDYQIAGFDETSRACPGKAVKAAWLEDREEVFFYCTVHFKVAEPFLEARGIPSDDL